MMESRKEFTVCPRKVPIRPGFGFHYISHRPTNNSVFPELQQNKNSKNFLTGESIIDFIKKGVKSYQTQDYSFKSLSKFSLDCKYINNFSDLNSFLDRSGVPILSRLLKIEPGENLNQFLDSTKFDENHKSFFVKCSYETGEWRLSKQNPNNVPSVGNEFLFREHFGDSFVTKVVFGTDALFKIDLKGPEESETEIENIENSICNLLRERNNTKRENFLQKLPPLDSFKLVRLLTSSSATEQITNFQQMSNYIDNMMLMSFKTPRVISATVSFYDGQLEQEFNLKGFKETVRKLEERVIPRSLDLFQCVQFFENLLAVGEYPEFDHEKRQFATEARKHSLDYLGNVSRFIEELETTCWSPELPIVPPAEEVTRDFSSRQSDSIQIRQKISRLSGHPLGTGAVQEKKSVLSVTGDSLYSLYSALWEKLSSFLDEGSKGVPKFVLFPCSTPGESPELMSRNSYGRGSLLYFPSKPFDFKEILIKKEEAEDQKWAMHKYLKVYEVLNIHKLDIEDGIKNYGMPDTPEEHFRVESKPRAVSRVDNISFLFHKKVSNEIETHIEEIVKIVESLGRDENSLTVTQLEEIISTLNDLNNARVAVALSGEKLAENLGKMDYGPKVWITFAGSARFNESFLKEIDNAIKRDLCDEEEMRDLYAYCKKHVELEEARDKASREVLKSCFSADSVLRNEYKNTKNVKIEESITALKKVELFLSKVHNDIDSEAVLKFLHFVKIKFDSEFVI